MDRKKKASPERVKPHQIRLPEFILVKPIGLGDAIKQATTSMGIKPCSGCQKRAEALNRRLIFSKKILNVR